MNQSRSCDTNLFPVFLKLAGRRCVAVGGGAIGEGKIGSLLKAGAEIVVVAPEVTPNVREWARAAKLTWRARKFSPADLEGAFLVVAATPRRDVNHLVFCEARRRGVLCNVVDDPERCDFYYPAVLRRGSLQIAISTGGLSPALAQRLRRQLEQQFASEYGVWLEELGRTRRLLINTPMEEGHRRRWLHHLSTHQAFERFVREKSAEGGSA
jgi:precorrin-2 dehydrogenase/sirohydrochlorin ferrochelatase